MERFTGFLMAVLINMAFRSGFLLLAVVTFILYLLIKIPLYITFIVLGVWVLYSILITIGITFVSNCNAVPRNQKGIRLHAGRNAHFDAMYKGGTSAAEAAGTTETTETQTTADTQGDSGADNL